MNFAAIALWVALCIITQSVAFASGDEGGAHAVPQPRKCDFSGKERFTFHVDGAVMGVFEKFTPPVAGAAEPTALFENGLILRATYVLPWSEANTGNPKIKELHDVAVFGLSSDLEVSKQILELTETDIIEKKWEVSSDRSTCLVVDSMKLSVKDVIKINPR